MEKNLDLIVDYTRKFIEAVTPVAKQAYEIGLLTLRIDAAQSLIFGIALLAIRVLMLKKVRSDWAKANLKASLPENKGNPWRNEVADHLPAIGVPHFICGMVSVLMGIVGAFQILSVWMWVKLFSPELWLAHQAVEKILK